jgi:hypothetical protein
MISSHPSECSGSSSLAISVKSASSVPACFLESCELHPVLAAGARTPEASSGSPSQKLTGSFVLPGFSSEGKKALANKPGLTVPRDNGCCGSIAPIELVVQTGANNVVLFAMTDGKTRARDGIEEGAVGAAEIDKEVLDP